MVRPTLETIPGEVRQMIIELLESDLRDLKHLCEVSRTLYNDTIRFLYRTILFESGENNVEDISTLNLCTPRDNGLLRYTRAVQVRSTFTVDKSERCLHYDFDKYNYFNEYNTDEFASDLQEILSGCEEGRILSLDWSTGTCVPQSLLGPHGYFPEKQPNIETIRLITDGACPAHVHHKLQLALGEFPRLKKLSWKGLCSTQDFEALADVLRKRFKQLEELEVDLTYYNLIQEIIGGRFFVTSDDDGDDTDEDDDYDFVFVAKIIKLERGIMPFTNLTSLDLSGVSFAPGDKQDVKQRMLDGIVHSFDFGSLFLLRLRRCPGWGLLLELLASSSRPMRLKVLEIQSSPLTIHSDDNMSAKENQTIGAFIQTFQGLRELIISTCGPDDSTGLWNAMLNHRATLARFVQHQRTAALSQLRLLDVNGLSVINPRDSNDRPLGTENPLGELDLIAVGLCCEPQTMRRLLCDFPGKNMLQVLHMRQSGLDLYSVPSWAERAGISDTDFDCTDMDLPVPKADIPKLGTEFALFAQWAFGPHGIPSLRLLAFGDFSHDGRFRDTTLLLCRREIPDTWGSDAGSSDTFLRFREMKKGEDRELWDLYERELGVLAACSTDSLLTF